MAAGKNAASEILESEGFISIDADKVVHEAVEKAKDKIIETFSQEADKRKIKLLNDDETVNRRELGRLVFSDSSLLKKQEEIIHPVVDGIINDFIDVNSDKSIVVNATVLYKTPVIKRCDCIIFIDAPFLIRLFRAKKRDGMKINQIISRFKSQKNLFTKYKICGADIYRVRNSGRRLSLQRKLHTVIKKCLQKDD